MNDHAPVVVSLTSRKSIREPFTIALVKLNKLSKLEKVTLFCVGIPNSLIYDSHNFWKHSLIFLSTQTLFKCWLINFPLFLIYSSYSANAAFRLSKSAFGTLFKFDKFKFNKAAYGLANSLKKVGNNFSPAASVAFTKSINDTTPSTVLVIS